MGFKYTVVLEDWSFGELNDAENYQEFDNPEDAFALHDEIDIAILEKEINL